MLKAFDSIWLIDFEFNEPPGELPTPLCAVGKNHFTGEVRVWTNHQPDGAPVYTAGPRDMVVAYAAEAEGKCIRRLGWPLPRHCLDLFPVFRSHVNRFSEHNPANLLAALNYFNLPGITSVTKDEMRMLAQRGGSLSHEEMGALVEYCRTDVDALEDLLPELTDRLDLRHALLMGRYSMGAVSAMQCAGVPLDQELLHRIVAGKDGIRSGLIEAVDKDFGVYLGGRFSQSRFVDLVNRMNIEWPRTPTGRPRLDEDTFKQQAKVYPRLKPLAELRKTIAALGNIEPSVGSDGRNRTSIRPFASITGRNQPSTATNVYSWPKWMRHLVRAPDRRVIIVFDYEQQEFCIAAALSRDAQMLSAYRSGDPYLATAIRAGRTPVGSTKSTHPAVRDLYKTALLAIQYHCSAFGLASSVGGYAAAKSLIEEHQQLYAVYHRWSQQQIDRVMLGSPLTTPFGWTVRKGDRTPATALKSRSLANWTVQATGSDILRIATIALVEQGFCVIAPVHDAIVVECDLDVVQDVVMEASRHMSLASEIVLGGEACRVEAKVLLPSHDIMTHNVPEMFRRVISLLPDE